MVTAGSDRLWTGFCRLIVAGIPEPNFGVRVKFM